MHFQWIFSFGFKRFCNGGNSVFIAKIDLDFAVVFQRVCTGFVFNNFEKQLKSRGQLFNEKAGVITIYNTPLVNINLQRIKKTSEVLAKFIGILVAFIWNYFFNVKWTWKEK